MSVKSAWYLDYTLHSHKTKPDGPHLEGSKTYVSGILLVRAAVYDSNWTKTQAKDEQFEIYITIFRHIEI